MTTAQQALLRLLRSSTWYTVGDLAEVLADATTLVAQCVEAGWLEERAGRYRLTAAGTVAKRLVPR